MPIRSVPPTRATRLVLAAVAALAAAPVCAQSTAAAGGDSDPGLVIIRTVQPRIAYRGVPLEDNPIRSRATTFPARVFHDAFDGTLGGLVGDEALDQHGSAGLAGGIDRTLAGGRLLPTPTMFGPGAQGGSLGRIPDGPGARIGETVQGATAGIADRINSTMQAIMPALQETGR